MNFLLVGCGAAVGACTRYLTSLWFARMTKKAPAPWHLPWGTLFVNIVGCFLIGLYADSPLLPSKAAKELILLGFLGGLTTFATFSLEASSLFQDKRYKSLALYIFLQVILSLAAVTGGKMIYA